MTVPQTVGSATYDAANELRSWNGISNVYDANGNVVNDTVHTYSWNARNQLVAIDSGGAAAFAYDPRGRRVNRTISGSSSTGYLYDGSNPVQELGGLTPSANMLEVGVDEYFNRTDSSGSSTYIVDVQGSTIALTDSNGTVQTQYSYDPYGVTTSNGAATTNSYVYTGRESDTAGLYYYRARYYNPQTGRFISEDPLGFAGSGSNLYAYASGDPIDFNDPFGLDKGGPNNNQPQRPKKKPCSDSQRIGGAVEALEAGGDAAIAANLAYLNVAGAGMLVGLGCLEPTPLEPVTCAASGFGAAALLGGSVVLSNLAAIEVKEGVIPGIEEAFCTQ